MRSTLVVCALAACGSTTDGARSLCAAGGAIQGECPLEDRTVEGDPSAMYCLRIGGLG